VLALQKDNAAAAVVSSNAGQVLWGGIAGPSRAARVADRLLADDMFSGWGIRTLSERAAAYNPMSYHLGSVWPHDNGLILAGFRRYGCDAQALQVFDAIFDAAANFRDNRLPELYCGFPRGDEQAPVRYPTACSLQAWAAGSIPHALWNLLGLRADAVHSHLRIVRPQLPDWLDWIALDGLRVGTSTLDLRFERSKGTAAEAHWIIKEGELAVETVVTTDPHAWQPK
jgi:glycogen debranching enzyme